MKTALSIDALRDAVADMPDDRLQDARLAALEHLQDQGTPTTRHEDWKYTDLANVIELSNQWLADGATTPAPMSFADAAASVADRFDAHWLIIANGVVDNDSVKAAQNAGISVSLLSDTPPEMEIEAPLADLNIALLHDGLHIRVEAGCVHDKPIGILVIDDATATIGVSQVRVEIELADNSASSFIEYHASSGDASHYANSVVNLALGDNAAADYVRIQNRDRAHSQTGRLTARLSRNSRLDHCAFDFGGKLVRNDLKIELNGPGSSTSLHGLYLADTAQHIDNHTRVDHSVGPAVSDTEYRGILTGSSRCIWNGKAIVHDGADGTDAQQTNHNLLLSAKAEIDAKPELEIYADDVKCSHGTTIGQLDENALFYLRTRGLGQRAAHELLTRAFAQTIVTKVPIRSFQEAIGADVATRLGELSTEGGE